MGHDGGVGTRILTVEDDERIRTAVKLALEDEGWTVEEAGNGEDALEPFHRQPADVVLIDIMLPGHRRLRGVPVDPPPERRARSSWSRPAPTPTTWWPGSRPAPTTTSPSRSPRRSCRPASGPCCAGPGPPQPGHARLDVRRPRDHPRRGQGAASPATRCTSPRPSSGCCASWRPTPGGCSAARCLLDRVWGYGYFGDGRLVDVHVRRLRTKVEADPANPRHVVTVRGLGYRLQA